MLKMLSNNEENSFKIVFDMIEKIKLNTLFHYKTLNIRDEIFQMYSYIVMRVYVNVLVTRVCHKFDGCKKK